MILDKFEDHEFEYLQSVTGDSLSIPSRNTSIAFFQVVNEKASDCEIARR